MAKLVILTGQRFGRLLVADQRKQHDGRRDFFWLCRCDCGGEIWARTRHLNCGAIRSCGCLRAETLAKGQAIVHNRPPRVVHRGWVAPSRRECSQCGEVKPISQFAQHKGRKANEYRKTCLECDLKNAAAKAAQWREAHLERALEIGRASDRRTRPGRHKQPEIIKYQSGYYRGHKESVMARAKEWKTANPQKVLAATVARQRKIRRATPPWSNLRSIEAIYVTCPSDHHVDHIIPINGKTIDGYRVSGLHVPWNLQYLLSGINIGKSNRMRPEDHALCEALPSPPPAVDGAQYRLPFYKHHAAIAH